MYGLLEVFKVFGEGHRGIHALIAMIMGFLVAISSGVLTFIQTFTPWFVILVIVIFFILFAVKMFGVKDDSITKAFHENSAIRTWIIIFTVLIILFSLGAGFGQQSLEQGQSGGTTTSVVTGNQTAPTDTGSFSQNLYNTIYHPKILGFLLIMLIVVIAMLLLTEPEAP
jgi:NADH:ubiquinone oxidoreductase subunit 6 (subunit J)